MQSLLWNNYTDLMQLITVPMIELCHSCLQGGLVDYPDEDSEEEEEDEESNSTPPTKRLRVSS